MRPEQKPTVLHWVRALASLCLQPGFPCPERVCQLAVAAVASAPRRETLPSQAHSEGSVRV